MSYQTVDPGGRLTRSERFEAPFASMMHDFIATAEHVVFPVFPVTASMERAMAGGPPVGVGTPDLGTHLGVMRRDGSVAEMRWFDTEACYVFSPRECLFGGQPHRCAHDAIRGRCRCSPAWTGRRRIRRRRRRVFASGPSTSGTTPGGITRRYLDELPCEFPRLDERFALNGYRHAYCAGNVGQTGLHFNAPRPLRLGERRPGRLRAAGRRYGRRTRLRAAGSRLRGG